ncbi:unnamed protein product [Rhizoctonia solani]|uniref:Phytocyanin domain-containing protein n=1 Tax=Rhizoctonia solani TaxID=456999 RepID=A0A8H3CRB9_9AGAM|nr:unnamed protein product [Rhizoctonia solani]
MVRVFAPIFSALALSSAVLAIPMGMGMSSEPSVSEPAPALASTTSSAMMHDATSTSAANAHASSTMAQEATSTSAAMGHQATTTSTAMGHEMTTTSAAMGHETTSTSSAAAHTTAAPSYGSGYANWGTDLNSCVQMCQAKFGGGLSSAPPSTTTAAPAAGTGATHTVIVAPTKGVLRYVPFAVNASVGDTVRFMWGAGPHTVTKSSALTVCNKSADATSFASGQQNASFVFDQVVNNTEPTFFFCAVPNHCQKGMFGIINPPSAPAGAATSVGAMMSTWTSQNPDLAKMQTAVDAMTINTPAYNWASNLDVSSIPTEAHESLVQNVFYTRMFYAANTGADQGASRPDGQPISIPNDVSTLLTGTAGNPAGASGVPAGGVPSGTPTSAPANSTPQPSANGAGSIVASSALMAVAAIFSSLFLL